MVQNTCKPAKLGGESNDSYGLKKILETSRIAGFSEPSTDSTDNGDESNGPEGKQKNKTQLLYFEWSPPWHVRWRLSGEGCHWEYDGKNGEFENIDFRFPWLSDTSEMGFGTTQTGCRIHRTYVSLIGSGEGRHTTHLLKCVLLLSTSQTAWKQSSDVLSDIFFDILSDISSDISSDILSDISSDILSDIFLTYLLTFFLTNRLTLFLTYLLTIFLTYLSTCFLTYLLTFFLTYQNQNLTSTASQKSRSANSIFTSHHAAKVLSRTTLCM